MNRHSIIGNLTKDPELRATGNGKDCCAFRIAVDDVSLDGGKTTTYFDCTAWGELATACAKSLKQGSRVCVEGKLYTKPYVGKDGKAYGNILVSVYGCYVSVKNGPFVQKPEPKPEAKPEPKMSDMANIDPLDIHF